MARVYLVTEEEMRSLLNTLKLESMSDCNLMTRDSADYDKPATMRDCHRAFHLVVTRWSQSIGFDGVR